MAGRLSRRKLENIRRTEAQIVITANAGCLLQIVVSRGSNITAFGSLIPSTARPQLPRIATAALIDESELRQPRRACKFFPWWICSVAKSSAASPGGAKSIGRS